MKDERIRRLKKQYDKGDVIGLAVIHGLGKPGGFVQEVAYHVDFVRKPGDDGQRFEEVSEREWNALKALGVPVVHEN